MANRNKELVPDKSLVKGRAPTTGLCPEGWYEQLIIKLKADSL